MKDTFIGTAARNIPSSEYQCFVLKKPYTFISGKVSFVLPSGKYIGSKKNKTGVFYYAPQEIKSSSSWFDFNHGKQRGIYLDNTANSGNLFAPNPTGYDYRPVRTFVLPSDIFHYIQRNC